MAKYVDADKLRLEIKNMGLFETAKFIKTFPSEDVSPVIHAHWRYMHRSKSFGLFVGACSNCGSPNIVADYCGNCGAKMDEEVEDAKIYKHR